MSAVERERIIDHRLFGDLGPLLADTLPCDYNDYRDRLHLSDPDICKILPMARLLNRVLSKPELNEVRLGQELTDILPDMWVRKVNGEQCYHLWFVKHDPHSIYNIRQHLAGLFRKKAPHEVYEMGSHDIPDPKMVMAEFVIRSMTVNELLADAAEGQWVRTNQQRWVRFYPTNLDASSLDNQVGVLFGRVMGER